MWTVKTTDETETKEMGFWRKMPHALDDQNKNIVREVTEYIQLLKSQV